jgi:AraC-like DNA-binding protein
MEHDMLEPNDLTLRLISLKWPREWAYGGEGLAFVLPSEGSGRYLEGKTTQRLAPGDVHISDGGRAGRIRPFDRGAIVFWCFAVRLEHVYPLLAAHEIPLFHTVSEKLKGSRLHTASSPTARQCHRLLKHIPPVLELEGRSHALRIATIVLAEEFRAARGRRLGVEGAAERLNRVLEGLSSEDLLDLSVEDLAVKFGCTRRHLNRLFQRHFGFSLSALRMEIRLLKAMSLLRNPDAKVSLVAEQCGFHHLGLFNACFKKRFSSTPGAWRTHSAEACGPPESERTRLSICPLHAKGLCGWSDLAPAGLKGRKPSA